MSDEDLDVPEEDTDDSARLDVGSPTDLYAIFQKERAAELDAYRKYTSSAKYVDHLLQAVATLQTPESFTPGTLVQWKTFLKGAEYPEYGSPAVVVELVENPRAVDEDGDPVPHPVDVFIGYLDGRQDLQIVATHSRRLTAWDVESSGGV